MPRGPRLDAPGVLHHVMVRGIEGRRVFWTAPDYDDFLARVENLATTGAWVVYAWALLPNHAHLLVRTGARPLPRSMRSLLTGYAGTFNRRHRRRGHLFQNRYKSIVVEEEAYFLELVRYLHLNPLRAGVVKDLAALTKYPYSGHATLHGRVPRPWQEVETVLGQFSPRVEEARRRYQAFVAAGVAQGRRPELQGGGLVRSAGGWAAVRALRRGREAHTADERILGTGEFVEAILREAERQAQARAARQGHPLNPTILVQRIGITLGVPTEAILGPSQGRRAAEARQLIAYIWTERLGRLASDLAEELGRTRGGICLAAKRGAERAKAYTAEIDRWCR
jgi:REP-associated tyrosine transposase